MPEYKIKIVVEGDDRASGPLRGISGALGQMGTIAGGIGLASLFGGMVDGAQRAGQAMVGLVTDAGSLEAQIDAIGALSGASAGEIEQLGQLITDLGINPNLKVSTNEAADAIEMLVRNGLTLGEVFGGAAEQTVLLANSTGAEFGTAADIATDAMAIFGIEAANMGDAVNGITGVVAQSKFDINDYQMALAQGGAAAATAGVSFDEFNGAVTAIASNFASGSDAGTSLKTMIQRLVPQSDEAAAAMAELGLEFFNADGSMRDMAEVAGQLNRALFGQVEFSTMVGGRTADQNEEMKRLQGRYNSISTSIKDYQSGINGAGLSEEQRAKKVGELQSQLAAVEAQMGPLAAIQGEMVNTTRQLTEEERLNYLTTIFGADAMRAAAAMAGYTEEEFAGLLETLGQTDAADQAAQRMDNLAGDVEIFGGVMEAVGLQIGDAFQEPARQAVQGLSQALSDLTPTLVSWAEGAAGALSGAMESLSTPEVQAAAQSAWTAIESVFTGQAVTVSVDYKVEAPPSGLEPPPMKPIKMSDLISGEKVAIPVESMWASETPDELMQRVTATTWTVTLFGQWQMEVPDWMKTGVITLAVALSEGGRDGIGTAVAEAVAAGLSTVSFDGAGFADWFAQQEFSIPITGAGVDGTIKIDGQALIDAAAAAQESISQAGDNIGYSLGAAWGNIQSGWDSSMAMLGGYFSGFGAAIQAVQSWTWPTLPEFTWPTLPAWTWPSLPVFRWPAMPSFSWPALPSWSWPAMPSFRWPEIPTPGWLSQLSGFFGGGGKAVGGRAGGLTWVGEFGPELVSLPQGSFVHTAGESRRLAAGAMGGQVINVAATINSPLDVEELTRKVADRLKRRSF